MLINLSNHPVCKWSEEQRLTAEKSYGDIIDMPFPEVDPSFGEDDILRLSDEYCKKIISMAPDRNTTTIHVMGEMCLTFSLVSVLKQNGYTCIAATTRRMVQDLGDGRKITAFIFTRFRKY